MTDFSNPRHQQTKISALSNLTDLNKLANHLIKAIKLAQNPQVPNVQPQRDILDYYLNNLDEAVKKFKEFAVEHGYAGDPRRILNTRGKGFLTDAQIKKLLEDEIKYLKEYWSDLFTEEKIELRKDVGSDLEPFDIIAAGLLFKIYAVGQKLNGLPILPASLYGTIDYNPTLDKETLRYLFLRFVPAPIPYENHPILKPPKLPPENDEGLPPFKAYAPFNKPQSKAFSENTPRQTSTMKLPPLTQPSTTTATAQLPINNNSFNLSQTNKTTLSTNRIGLPKTSETIIKQEKIAKKIITTLHKVTKLAEKVQSKSNRQKNESTTEDSTQSAHYTANKKGKKINLSNSLFYQIYSGRKHLEFDHEVFRNALNTFREHTKSPQEVKVLRDSFLSLQFADVLLGHFYPELNFKPNPLEETLIRVSIDAAALKVLEEKFGMGTKDAFKFLYSPINEMVLREFKEIMRPYVKDLDYLVGNRHFQSYFTDPDAIWRKDTSEGSSAYDESSNEILEYINNVWSRWKEMPKSDYEGSKGKEGLGSKMWEETKDWLKWPLAGLALGPLLGGLIGPTFRAIRQGPQYTFEHPELIADDALRGGLVGPIGGLAFSGAEDLIEKRKYIKGLAKLLLAASPALIALLTLPSSKSTS
jgi:hypothetical protein